MRIHGGRAREETQRRQRLEIGRVLVQVDIVWVEHAVSSSLDMWPTPIGRSPIIAVASVESVN
jgi:hypothetical protein